MKSLAFALYLLLTFSAFAAQMGETCSISPDVCASYETDVDFIPYRENRFKLSVKTSKGEALVLKKVDLWMQMGQHGHGSSPLKVTQVAPGEYDVTRAFFPMAGEWQIRAFIGDEILILSVVIKD